MNFITTDEKLKERVKELTCLYEISKIISHSDSFKKEVLKKIISSTKKAWRFNNDAIVEINIQNLHLSTAKIPGTTIFQCSSITIFNTAAGFIRVHYPATKYTIEDFLDDEQKLLHTIAYEIETYIEKFQNLEKKALLRQTIERMDRLSLLGEMTAGIAHELNTPLANILGFAELIKDSNTDPEITSDISILINSVIYSREIIKKLMFFSCEMPQQLEPTKLKPLVTFALSFLKQNFQKKEIKNEVFFKNDDLTANIDSIQITQVLFNLLLNAIYISPNKSIIKLIIDSDDLNIYITIEDQGMGIPVAIRHKIFEPFFTTKPSKEGLGLGLSVVHGIVENHNGEIIIKDNFPKGTIFTIRLPIT
ncbi:sensor histidine kinase [Flavobacterium sp. FlaQc-57]|uniref:sensor histidine kinase n=1 Tax=Flavobacterium sp. FlaQc-57 TaxID=3374186 RepID=UPI003756D213